jgi:hypothetical protein
MLSQSIAEFTWKESYLMGDISKRIMELSDKTKEQRVDSTLKFDSSDAAGKELEDWDKRFQADREDGSREKKS